MVAFKWGDVMQLSNFKWFRKYKRGIWYRHKFTNEALQLCCTFMGCWWARYDEINRYSTVIDIEEW